MTPHQNPELSQQDQPQRRDKSLLALRDPTPKQHELTPETADLSLPHAADGEMPLPSHAARGNKSDPSHLDNAKRVKLAFTAKDYEYLFGADAAADRKLAQQTRSTRQGKFQKRLARVQSAVENFVPEVKPGNQTALNTRAAPFAAYLARMHRSIHELWGFGQLEEWDEKPGSSPYNNRNLVTELEFVLNGDGTMIGSVSPDPRACSSTTSPRSTSPTPRGRSPIPRARSARPTGRSMSTGTSSATSGSARPRGPTRTSSKMPRPAPTRRRRCSTCLGRPRGRCGCRARCGRAGAGRRRAARGGCSDSTTPTLRIARSGWRSTARWPPLRARRGIPPSRSPSQPAGPAPPRRRTPPTRARRRPRCAGSPRSPRGTPRIFWRWRRSPSRPAARRSARRTISPRCSPIWRARESAGRDRSSW